MLIIARISVPSGSLQDPTFESEVMLLRTSENRRTKNGPSGDGKIGGNPLPLLPHGASLTGTLDTGGIIEDGKRRPNCRPSGN